MSSRPASPPPLPRWPFFVGAGILIFVAFYLLITAGRPPAVPPLIAGMFCLGGSIVLCAVPFIVENERRLRLAEAAVRDASDAQLRRLAQTADQLAHVVSRSQSTEEQAGRALGTLEEVAERMVAQAEELAAALARSGEREQAAQAEELQRLTEERDQKLTALEIRLNAMSVALSETQVAIKKSATGHSRAIEALASRLDEVAEELRGALAASAGRPAPAPVDDVPAIPHEHGILDTASMRFEAEHPTTSAPHPGFVVEVETPAMPAATPPPQETAVEAPPETDSEAPAPAPTVEPPEEPVSDALSAPAEPAGETVPAATPRPRRARAHRTVEKPVDDSSETDSPGPVEEVPPAKPTAPLELALEGMPEPRPVMRLNRREPPGSTSLVATAYIGIGNKLYLRGDGPGLTWERGVPMQFLAIGKWGWTTTDASVPVTCRVYRNDDTPMLEENVVIDPGTKAEITPKF